MPPFTFCKARERPLEHDQHLALRAAKRLRLLKVFVKDALLLVFFKAVSFLVPSTELVLN